MGTVDSTQLLPMRLVLGGGTLAPSKEILYADYISVGAASKAFTDLQTLGKSGAACQQTQDLITNNTDLMSKTNSNQFYNGPLAQQQFSNLETIGFKFEQIQKYVNNSNELTKIVNDIKSYNTKLSDLKKNCRRELLHNTADKFNESKIEWDGFPKVKTYNYTSLDYSPIISPEVDPEFNVCDDTEILDYEELSSSSRKVELKDGIGTVYDTYYKYSVKFKIHKYKHIKYWNFFKNIDSFLDPSFAQVEALYAKVGLDLPYEPGKIVGPDADN